ncbi:Choline transporter-like [Dillenia turbinata]|uniref:Choline transporter-like protein n=1 Tax=Dillenia turbinata TaxID=194707 RepID=A0AAN8W5N0_9MAGN
MQVRQENINIETTVATAFFTKLFQYLFFIQFGLITILIIFLTIRGFLSTNSRTHHFHPSLFYFPLLSSTALAAIVALLWPPITRHTPSKAIKAAFRLSPFFTLAAAILLVSIGSAPGLAAGALALIFAIIQSLYACWVSQKFDFTTKIFSASLALVPAKISLLITLSVLTGAIFCCFCIAGIGGATATGTNLDKLFIFVILLSLAWTMHVIKNALQVAISSTTYKLFKLGLDRVDDVMTAFADSVKHSMGSVCIGSALVPVLGLIRGSGRAVSLGAGDADEMMFSCASCYSGLTDRLVMCANRWGFVHVGFSNKGFIQASADVWELFRRAGLEHVIDTDLTAVFCFLCGATGAALCALLGGSWALVVHKQYATEVAIYAYLIGYFLVRVAMAWPQACVSGYYVAYAENPQSPQFDSTVQDRIREDRIRELARSQV